MWRLGYRVMDIVRDASVHSNRIQVAKWIKRFEKAKAQGVPDEAAVLSQPRSGRPPTVTPSVKNMMLKYCQGKRKRSTRRCAKWLRGKGITVSHESVRKHLLREGLYPYRRRRQPWLNKKQKTKRMKFARDYLDHDWENTLMTDESDFNLFARSNPKNDVVWASSYDEVPPMEVVKHAAGVKVWAGVSATGRTKLHFYKGTIGAKKYIEILKKAKDEMEEAMEDGDWCFQHDGASAHKAKLTNTWLEENVPEHITAGPQGEWPANSPDLNWVENVWAYMDEQMEENPPKSIAALKRRLKKIWKDMPQSMLAKMAKGMQARLSDVIAKKGACIGK